ncbi:pyridoxamine 5'-phosphate oxidase family protein [Streptomyces albus]|uniref:pyridoxamine 5'-phosphate oxidase family protein n=1 Tax=Streptomyces albus TaxID=1888 RepID=UPI0004C5B28F|nr:pyridoxamine 5'-phosphate oxidase family protein [Streptomyces albus]
MTAPARPPDQRRLDVLKRLDQDIDAWVATADPETGTPYLVPLSFLWDGTSLWLATPASSPTGRNLRSTGRVRLGIGPTRDVVLIEGTVDALTAGELPKGLGEAFAARTGFDPREAAGAYLYYRVTPDRLQAWREANELKRRDLMRDGQWTVGG